MQNKLVNLQWDHTIFDWLMLRIVWLINDFNYKKIKGYNWVLRYDKWMVGNVLIYQNPTSVN